MSISRRIPWIDYTKAFSIFAVVLYHTCCPPPLKSAAYLLCLPAFFFVSGMCANPSLSPVRFFRDKTLRLLVPFIVFGVLSWVAWLLIGRKYGDDAGQSAAWWYPLYGMSVGRSEPMIHNRPLWFLTCMISLEWLYYLLSHIRHAGGRWTAIIGVAIGGCVLAHLGQQWVWELSSAMLVLPLYALGHEQRDRVKIYLEQCSAAGLLGVLAVAAVLFGIGWIYNRDVRISEGVIGNPVLFYTTISAVTAVWLTLAGLLQRCCGTLRGWQYIGQNTLLVLCTHIPVFGLIKGVALLCGVSLQAFNTAPGWLTLWLGTFVILMPCAHLINRYCPWLLGRRMHHTKDA